MAVYVDASGIAWRGKRWHHLLADTTAELDAMARRLALRPEWRQKSGTPYEHYDVTDAKRAAALRFGALPIDRHGVVDLIERKRQEESIE